KARRPPGASCGDRRDSTPVSGPVTPYTTESPSEASIRLHAARRCGETSGCFPLCSSLAPGRRTTPGSCRLPSPAPIPLPDGPADSRSPSPEERGLQILLPDETLHPSPYVCKVYPPLSHTNASVDTDKKVSP